MRNQKLYRLILKRALIYQIDRCLSRLVTRARIELTRQHDSGFMVNQLPFNHALTSCFLVLVLAAAICSSPKHNLEPRVGIEPTPSPLPREYTTVVLPWQNLEPMEGLEPPMFVWRFTEPLLSPLSHIGLTSLPNLLDLQA